MTKAELIEALSEYPDDIEVVLPCEGYVDFFTSIDKVYEATQVTGIALAVPHREQVVVLDWAMRGL